MHLRIASNAETRRCFLKAIVLALSGTGLGIHVPMSTNLPERRMHYDKASGARSSVNAVIGR